MIDEIGLIKPDQEKISAWIQEISDLRKEIQKSVIKHLQLTKKQLTPEQSTKFIQFLQDEMGDHQVPGMTGFLK